RARPGLPVRAAAAAARGRGAARRGRAAARRRLTSPRMPSPVLRATRDLPLATTITGSIPRPSWFDQALGGRTFRQARGDSRYREQYQDAVSSHIRDQERAGIDVVTDGDCRFDLDVGGQSWFLYPARRLEGLAGGDHPPAPGYGAGRGTIIFEAME